MRDYPHRVNDDNASQRRRRWPRRLLIAVLVLVALVALLYFLVLPVYARHRLDQMLRDMGITNARYTLKHITLREVEVADAPLGETGWLTANRIGAHFNPVHLTTGRVGDIDIIGATYTVNVNQ